MKKITSLSFLFVAAVIAIASCKKDSSTSSTGSSGTRTFSCTGITPSFSADVQPILATVCSINSTCHGSGSTNSGGALTTFAEVSARKSNIRAQILSGNMPQSGNITQAQVNAFICWIDNGGPNN
ncbi:MAG: hypothetical protein JST86_02875 [Bacteroidetes bacterium]|nr:hypothetical protein [Bacteroidota bacterium]